MSDNESDHQDGTNTIRRQSTSERRSSQVTLIYNFQHSIFYDINDDAINDENNCSSKINDESFSDRTEEKYAPMEDLNLEQNYIEEEYTPMEKPDSEQNYIEEEYTPMEKPDSEQDNSDEEYAVMKDYSHLNSKPEEFEINQSIKLLTDLDYFVPPFNPNIKPLYDYRNKLILNPLISVSSEIDENMYEYMKIKEESMNAGGSEIHVLKNDLLKMRLFTFNEFLWIVKCPRKTKNYNRFHFGDKIISVNNKKVSTYNEFKETLISTRKLDTLKFRIQRLPFAKIFGVKVENYQSVFHFNKDSKFIILNNPKNPENNKWLITEIDGESIDYICNEIKLKSVFEGKQNNYATFIIHPVDFLTKNLKIQFSLPQRNL